MKPAQIFHQYIWIINTLRAYRRLTFEELNQKWQDDKVADGNLLQRSSFNRHRDVILEIPIGCPDFWDTLCCIFASVNLIVELKTNEVMDGLFFIYVLTVVMSIMLSGLFEGNEVKEAE